MTAPGTITVRIDDLHRLARLVAPPDNSDDLLDEARTLAIEYLASVEHQRDCGVDPPVLPAILGRLVDLLTDEEQAT